MKRIILCICLFIFIRTEAQQINPVPDYVFSNKMSVGRNAVTDTAAYFSIGPRYGAIRGMMPPMVTDTASMSATKRNGLLIFSIQKNKYLYWDSVGSKWAEMAGTAGSAITGSGVAGYMPEFTTSTNLDTTRLYHSAGRFAIGTTSPSSFFDVIGTKSYAVGEQEGIRIIGSIAGRQGISFGYDSTSADQYANIQSHTGSERTTINYLGEKHKFTFGQVETAALYIDSLGNVGVRNTSPSYILDISGTMRSTGNTYLGTSSAETYINTTSDAGTYALQVAGSIYNTTGAVLAASSGNVGIGATSPGSKLDVQGAISSSSAYKLNNQDYSQVAIMDGNGAFAGGYNLSITGNTAKHAFLGAISGYYYQADPARILFFVNSSQSAGTNAQARLAITNDGEVYVNTTLDAGAYALQVAGSIYNTTGAVLAASSGNVLIGRNSAVIGETFSTTGFAIIGTSAQGVFGDGGTSNVVAGSYTNSAFEIRTNNTERMRITTSGSVGIGTTSPGANLDVSSGVSQGSGTAIRTIRISGAGDDAQVLEFFNNWTGNAFVRAKITSDGDGASQAYGTLKFFTTQNSSVGTTERMRISSGGNVGIGTTTPSQPLHVNGNILTAAPSGGTAKPFKIGAAATVSPTSPNRTIEIEIDGTTYYLHAKTTND